MACGILVLQSEKEPLPPEVEGGVLAAGSRWKNLFLFIPSLSASKSSEPGNLTLAALAFKSPRGVKCILLGWRCCINNFILNPCRQQHSPSWLGPLFSCFYLAPTSQTCTL